MGIANPVTKPEVTIFFVIIFFVFSRKPKI